MEKKKILFILIGILVLLYPVLGFGRDYFLKKIPYGNVFGMTLNVSAQENEKPMEEIIDGSVIRQSFIAGNNRIHSIKLYGATYARINQGILKIRLIDAENGNQLEKWDVDVSALEDNQYFSLDMKNKQDLSGRKCVLEITSKGAFPGNAVTLYACQKNVYSDGEFSIDGKRQRGDLCFQIYEFLEKRSFVHVKIWLRIYVSAIAGCILYAVCQTGGKRIRKSGDEETTNHINI